MLKPKYYLAFLAVLVVKICLFFTCSHYLIDTEFSVFLNQLNSTSFFSIYESGLANHLKFPYPAGMLYVLSAFFPLSHFSIYLSFLIPLVLSDLLIFGVLLKIAPTQFRKSFWLYWLSPISIYITYAHGQLDVIPTSLILLSLWFILNNQEKKSYFVLALACALKTSSALAIPFFLIFSWLKHQNLRLLAINCLLLVMTFFVINIPFLFQDGFLALVLQNREQAKVWNTFIYLNQSKFFILPAAYFLLALYAYNVKIIGNWTFISFLTFAFGVILFFVPPMPGWSYWVLPFLILFYTQNNKKHLWFFGAWNICYLIYYALTPQSDYFYLFKDYFPINAPTPSSYLTLNGIKTIFLNDLSFTLFQITLLLQLLVVHRYGIKIYKNMKFFNRPYLLGISGNSGVGKTTLSSYLKKLLGEEQVQMISGDDMHRWQRGDENWKNITHLNPRANALSNEIFFLRQLQAGKAIFRRHYDHTTGQFTSKIKIPSKSLIISEGLHAFYLQKVREFFDLKVYISPDENLSLHWKIIRDKSKRGYSTEQVLNQVESRSNDYQNFVHTQKNFADVIISTKTQNPIVNLGDPSEKLSLYYSYTCTNNVDLLPFIATLQNSGVTDIEHSYVENDKQVLIIKDDLNSSQIFKVCENLQSEHWKNISLNLTDKIDLNTLFVLYYLFWSINIES